MDLRGKTAIVTGASRGIGRVTALYLARAGASLVINYSSNYKAAEEVKNEIEASGGSALIFQADVSDYNQCEALIKAAIDQFKRIDILVNNAGITRDNLLIRMKVEEWQEVIDTNLSGVYNCCRAIMRPLLKQKSGGRIINIASVAGIHGNSGQANYAAAKGGVVQLTSSLAAAWAKDGIRANCVLPG
ncbi:MAG: SDR family oxidoreductase, partial [Bacillota bacterium]